MLYIYEYTDTEQDKVAGLRVDSPLKCINCQLNCHLLYCVAAPGNRPLAVNVILKGSSCFWRE